MSVKRTQDGETRGPGKKVHTPTTGGGSSNSFETINCPAGTDPVADSSTDTLNLAVGSAALTITGDSATDTVTFDVAQASIDHGTIGGLSDDDHTQYAKLTGRAGGQTLQGGTAGDEHLYLESTAHATKGEVRVISGIDFRVLSGNIHVASSKTVDGRDVSADGAILDKLRQDSITITGFSVPDTNGATPITVQDASTYAVNHPGWSFDPSTDEYLDIFCVCGAAFDSSKNIEVIVTAGQTTSNAVNDGASFDATLREYVDSSTDIDAMNVTGDIASTGAVDLTLPSTVHQFISGTITIASHGLVAGDKFRIRLFRDVSDANDDYPYDAYVYSFIRVRGAA